MAAAAASCAAGLPSEPGATAWSALGYEAVGDAAAEQADTLEVALGGCRGLVGWNQVRRAAAALLSVALTVAVAEARFGLGGWRHAPPLAAGRSGGWEQKAEVEQASGFTAKCGLIQKGVFYSTKDPGDFALDHIPSPEMCCAMCHGIPACKAWVWFNAHLDGCPFKCAIRVSQQLSSEARPGAVSGLPPLRPPMPPLAGPRQQAEPDKVSGEPSGAAGALGSVGDAAESQEDFHGTSAGEAPQPAAQQPLETPKCSGPEDNCWLSRCCADPGSSCYMKNAAWAGCRAECKAGIHLDDPANARTHWTCTRVRSKPQQQLPQVHLQYAQLPQQQQLLQQQQERPVVTGPGLAAGSDRLFCYALIQPQGYELQLLADQYSLGASIFGCDKYAVYSSAAIQIAPGVEARTVESDLKCEFHEIAWNSWIFIAVWKRVISDGFYRSYPWTVKVDADAVFFPERLRPVLLDHPEAGYLNNCKYGLHGPIEVLSRRAMEALAADYAAGGGARPARCVAGLPKLGIWGEDMFLDACLREVLGIKPEADNRLMCESHCDCPNWFWCRNGTGRVAYHPFKRVDMYRQCMANALYLS